MKYYTINEFSKILGVSAQTLRNWDKNKKLTPHHTGPNGYRYYSSEQLNQVLNIEYVKQDNKIDEVCINSILGLVNIYKNIVSDDMRVKFKKIEELIKESK